MVESKDPYSGSYPPSHSLMTDISHNDLPHVVILGAGPAGVGAAYELTRAGRARVTVLEQRDTVGGNAGSFQLDGVWVDYGSHRLHPACDPAILSNLRELMGDDLLDRPRHGRIRLENQWIHFPLKPGDLLLRMPKRFAFGVARDMVRKKSSINGQSDSFASVLEHSLGSTICRGFYFPYARQALGTAAGANGSHAGPSTGLGQLGRQNPPQGSERGPRTEEAGRGTLLLPPARLWPDHPASLRSRHLGRRAVRDGSAGNGIEREGDRVVAVAYEANGQSHRVPTRNVWSTLPVSLLVSSLQPEAPRETRKPRLAFRFEE